MKKIVLPKKNEFVFLLLINVNIPFCEMKKKKTLFTRICKHWRN